MTALEAAVVEAASALEALSIPYMLVGGLAVSLWGEPRATLDADLVVWVEPEQLADTVARLCERFRARVANPLEFVGRTRVLPAATSQEVPVDLVFGALPWEKEAIARARPVPVAGRNVAVVSVEDLVVMKAVSEREKDWEDARRLMRRHGSTVNRPYLEARLRELSEVLARPRILGLLG